jgi:serine/threonine-protein phosphatase 2A catalytic subunit
MALDIAKLDEHINSLREGNTLTEHEVKALCEKVRIE